MERGKPESTEAKRGGGDQGGRRARAKVKGVLFSRFFGSGRGRGPGGARGGQGGQGGPGRRFRVFWLWKGTLPGQTPEFRAGVQGAPGRP